MQVGRLGLLVRSDLGTVSVASGEIHFHVSSKEIGYLPQQNRVSWSLLCSRRGFVENEFHDAITSWLKMNLSSS